MDSSTSPIPTFPEIPGILTDTERENLARFERRLRLVKDRTRGVAEGWQTGFYLWGEGGVGKSRAVLDELIRLKVDYRLTNSRLTGKGLFELLEEYPDKIHVLEDMERLCQDANAAGVLRSALWATGPEQRHRERLVTWRVSGEKREVTFTGAVILTMNTALDLIPTLRALKSRIAHLHFQPTNDELAALMKVLAFGGFELGDSRLSPEQCLEVYEFVVAKCGEWGRNYDLRMLVNGFCDRLQHEAGHSMHDWRDLVESRIRERAHIPVTREAKIRDERAIALEIDALPLDGSEKLRLWEERTSKGKSAYYRRLSGD